MINKRVKGFFWDSCVHINLLQQDGKYKDTLMAWHERARSKEISIVISTLVIAEVCCLDKENKNRAEDIKLIRQHFENSFYQVYEVDRTIAEEATEIVRTHSIKPYDAIHIATAIRASVQELHSYDKKMLKLNGLIGNPPLSILHPPKVERQTDISEVKYNKREAPGGE